MSVKQVVMAAAGVGGGDKLYVEDVFSTYLYTGNSSTQTITNGIDLAGEGGLVWIKSRGETDGTPTATHNGLWDTERGAGTSGSSNKTLSSNLTSAENIAYSLADYVSSFNADGFTVKNGGGNHPFRTANHGFQNYASWTFRKAPKFFDVVTWTGDGTNGRQIAHNLGSVPGCIIVKEYQAGGRAWCVWHRSRTGKYFELNYTNAEQTDSGTRFGNGSVQVAPTDTYFTVGNNADTNANDTTRKYVAYIFAHDAGGFGDDGEQNVISCGSYVGNGSSTGPVINLGFEAQWVLVKYVGPFTANWQIMDVMRGMPNTTSGSEANMLAPNLEDAETSPFNIAPHPLGFQPLDGSGNINGSGNTYIYIAIRRPMKTPESGTEVFSVQTKGTLGAPAYNAGFPVDALFGRNNKNTIQGMQAWDRLRSTFSTTSTAAVEQTFSSIYLDYFDSNDGFDVAGGPDTNDIAWMFKRAPGFMDVVAYTGTGVSNSAKPHNLGVEPEFIMIKNRVTPDNWVAYSKYIDATAPWNYKLFPNLTSARDADAGIFGNQLPTATNFYTAGNNNFVNKSGNTYIAYLFATLPGVSKVGSYTGTGTTQTINCGFSSGARFVLIKRTDSSGDWYVWDSVRGIVAGNDPYLLLNSSAAEVTSTDYIDPVASGFQISSSAPAAINASGGSYIFLAIA